VTPVKSIEPTIRTLRACLEDDAVLPAAAGAAQDYAQACAQADQRLGTISLMLDQGSDYQALQAAEQDPPLLDLVAMLSFGEEKAWQAFCEKHDLPVAARLDAKAVQKLEALYAKGISSNHPLYKDFRTAVMSRDDTKCLQILQTILKLNPADENAKKELQRLRNKKVQEDLDSLKEALKGDDEDRIATLTETIASDAPDEKLRRVEAFVQGDAVRQSLRKRQAEERVPLLVADAGARRLSTDWRAVGEILEEVDGLVREHGLQFSDPETQTQLDDLRRYFQTERDANAKKLLFDKSLRAFVAFVEELETRLLTGAGVTYDELADRDEKFVRYWKELEAYQLPVGRDILQRLRAAGQELRTRLEHMQRNRRLRNLTVAGVVLAMLVAVTAVGLHAWKAHSISGELSGYQTKETCAPAEQLIARLRSEEEWLLRWPYLQSRIEEVDTWCQASRQTEKQAHDSLLTLESSFEGDSTSVSPAQLTKGLDDAHDLIKQLPTDLAVNLENQFNALKTQVELYFTSRLEEVVSQTRDSVSELEGLSGEELSFEKLAAQGAASTVLIGEKLVPLEALLHPSVESLRLPADLESRILAQRQRLDQFKAEVEEFTDVRRETAAAESLDAYLQALRRWQDIQFVEAAPALKILDTPPTENGFLADVLAGGDEGVLQAILEDVSGRHMSPDAPVERDLNYLLALRDDEYLNRIYEVTGIDYSKGGRQFTVWSQGTLDEATIGAGNKRWSGRCFDPGVSDIAVIFSQMEFAKVSGSFGPTQGKGVIRTRLSSTSEFINSLQLERMTDEKGEIFRRSLLELYDEIAHNREANPIAKAYLMTTLEDMAAPRSTSWGFHLCPSLLADLRKLHLVLGKVSLRSEDWLSSDKRERFNKVLGELLGSFQNRSYLQEAQARRDLLKTAAKAGLTFAGYVETDLTLVVNKTGRIHRELWYLGRDEGKPMLYANPLADAPASGDYEAPKIDDALPLSPVFALPVDRKALLKRYREDLSSTGNDEAPLPDEAVFVNSP
jgi:hypothetical protein